jgi:hypothetical protein
MERKIAKNYVFATLMRLVPSKGVQKLNQFVQLRLQRFVRIRVGVFTKSVN